MPFYDLVPLLAVSYKHPKHRSVPRKYSQRANILHSPRLKRSHHLKNVKNFCCDTHGSDTNQLNISTSAQKPFCPSVSQTVKYSEDVWWRTQPKRLHLLPAHHLDVLKPFWVLTTFSCFLETLCLFSAPQKDNLCTFLPLWGQVVQTRGKMFQCSESIRGTSPDEPVWNRAACVCVCVEWQEAVRLDLEGIAWLQIIRQIINQQITAFCWGD